VQQTRPRTSHHITSHPAPHFTSQLRRFDLPGCPRPTPVGRSTSLCRRRQTPPSNRPGPSPLALVRANTQASPARERIECPSFDVCCPSADSPPPALTPVHSIPSLLVPPSRHHAPRHRTSVRSCPRSRSLPASKSSAPGLDVVSATYRRPSCRSLSGFRVWNPRQSLLARLDHRTRRRSLFKVNKVSGNGSSACRSSRAPPCCPFHSLPWTISDPSEAQPRALSSKSPSLTNRKNLTSHPCLMLCPQASLSSTRDLTR